jgi:hypothetical protein
MMTGWKSKAAGGLAILFGLLGALLGLHDMSEGMRFVIEGMGILGVAHKIEKAGAAYEKAKSDPVDAVVRRNQH